VPGGHPGVRGVAGVGVWRAWPLGTRAGADAGAVRAGTRWAWGARSAGMWVRGRGGREAPRQVRPGGRLCPGSSPGECRPRRPGRLPAARGGARVALKTLRAAGASAVRDMGCLGCWPAGRGRAGCGGRGALGAGHAGASARRGRGGSAGAAGLAAGSRATAGGGARVVLKTVRIAYAAAFNCAPARLRGCARGAAGGARRCGRPPVAGGGAAQGERAGTRPARSGERGDRSRQRAIGLEREPGERGQMRSITLIVH
jgi:hypothetical protein